MFQGQNPGQRSSHLCERRRRQGRQEESELSDETRREHVEGARNISRGKKKTGSTGTIEDRVGGRDGGRKEEDEKVKDSFKKY